MLFIRLGSVGPDALLHANIVVVSRNSPVGLASHWEMRPRLRTYTYISNLKWASGGARARDNVSPGSGNTHRSGRRGAEISIAAVGLEKSRDSKCPV